MGIFDFFKQPDINKGVQEYKKVQPNDRSARIRYNHALRCSRPYGLLHREQRR